MENSRQITRFRWRNAKKLEAFSEATQVEETKVNLNSELEIDGDFSVSGEATVNDNLTVAKDTNLSGDLNVEGNISLNNVNVYGELKTSSYKPISKRINLNNLPSLPVGSILFIQLSSAGYNDSFAVARITHKTTAMISFTTSLNIFDEHMGQFKSICSFSVVRSGSKWKLEPHYYDQIGDEFSFNDGDEIYFFTL